MQSIRVEKQPSGKLPQFFADMMGWPEQVEVVAGVFRSMSAEDQSRDTILTKDYGQAGAIDYFGPAYGLPRAISGQNNYYLWGPQQFSGEVVIAVRQGRMKSYRNVPQSLNRRNKSSSSSGAMNIFETGKYLESNLVYELGP